MRPLLEAQDGHAADLIQGARSTFTLFRKAGHPKEKFEALAMLIFKASSTAADQ
jgi:hypothetical protein